MEFGILFKSNELVTLKHKLGVIENRILQLIFLDIQKENRNIATIALRDLQSIINKKNDSTIEGIKNILENLKTNSLKIVQGRNFGSFNIISAYEYIDETKSFNIEIPILLLNFLHEYKKEGYTPVNVAKYVTLKKTNAQRLYELIRQWTGSKNIVEYKVREIKDYLQLSDSYSLFQNFKVRVIEASIKELKEKELLDIYKVEYVKKGRSVDSIKFYVKDLEPRNYNFDTKKVDSDGNKPLEGQIDIEEVTAQEEPKKEEMMQEKKVIATTNYSNLEIILDKLEQFDIKEIKELQLKILAKRFDIKVLESSVDSLLEDITLEDFTSDNYLKEIRERAKKLQEKEVATTAIESTTEAPIIEDTIETTRKEAKKFDIVIADITRDLKNNKISIDAVELTKLKEKYSEIILTNAINILIQNNAEKKINNHLNYLISILENKKNDSKTNANKVSNSNSSQPSNFANFTQREYDYGKLERQLLGWDLSEDDEE